jgi:hypothetical protein
MKKFRISHIVCITLVLISIIFYNNPLAQNQRSITEVLDKDGRIQLGMDGSYNASEYSLSFGKNMEPIFRPREVTTITWSALGTTSTDFHDIICAVAVSGSNVYIGGWFDTVDGSPANRVAKWNGSSWTSMGSPNGYVWAIAIMGSDVYAGGAFTVMDGTTVNHIAKWNGSWSALQGTSGSTGVSNSVLALAVSGTNLYVGGLFHKLGSNDSFGTDANHIAMWDGTDWSTLGIGTVGVGDEVYALATNGTDLYVGGKFTTAGGSSANHIAKWDGSWSALGSGLGGSVYAIAIGSYVYAGGNFTTAGGNSANYIARWDGSNWSALSGGTNGVGAKVNTIVAYDSDVYVGGEFTTAGGGSANYIAKWNGLIWFNLGAGTNYVVRAMAVYLANETMIVGGDFTTADGTNYNYIAQFTDSVTPFPVELTKFNASVNGFSVLLEWQTATEVNNYGFNVERRVKNDEWVTIGFVKGNGNSNSLKYYSFIDKPIGGKEFMYRLKQIDFDGKFEYSDEVSVALTLPTNFALHQNFPNPCNPTTTIKYDVPETGKIQIRVYDVLGKLLATLVNEMKEPGSHEVSFDGSNLASGVYFYRIEADNFIESKKMILLK